MTARRYEHAGLDQPIVRLVPAALGLAADKTTSLLGFQRTRVAEVGESSHDSVGFLNWVLLNDPANAEHALAVADHLGWVHGYANRDAYQAGRVVERNYERIGRPFATKLPHFLPALYEDGARVLVENDQAFLAESLFNAARTAESEHNLPVDHEALTRSFTEFAQAKAVQARTMTNYSKALSLQKSPDAFERFLRLCVAWVRCGRRPYQDMWQDLRNLADPADEHAADLALLSAVLDTPVISKADGKFWQAYQAATVELARQDATFRRRLLTFVPRFEKMDKVIDTWTEILTGSGTIDELSSPADWLGMAITKWSKARRSAPWLKLVAKLAPRLRADGVPVVITPSTMNIDLLDLLVAERIPFTTKKSWFDLWFTNWIDDKRRGRRDLAALAADPRFGPMLVESVLAYHDQYYQDHREATQRMVNKTPALFQIKSQWAQGLPARLADSALPGLKDLLKTLEPFSFKEFPAVLAQLAATDVAEVLATTLRGGVWDELGWPALEEAVTKLLGSTKVADGDKIPVHLAGQGWPALVLRRGSTLLVVGPDEILLEHTLEIASDDLMAYYVDGRLLVVWGKYDTLAYWSDDPKATFSVPSKPKHPNWCEYVSSYPALALGTGLFTGHGILRAGDTELPKRGRPVSDGTTHWFLEWHDGYGHYDLREVDVETGATGERSLPEFIRSFVAKGTDLDVSNCDLRPAVPGTEGSLLGHANGLHGLRIRRERDRSWLGERIDGGQIKLPAGVLLHKVAAIMFPGDSEPRAVTEYARYELFDPDGRLLADFRDGYRLEMTRGTMLVPPIEWWHCLRVRDETGSLALRGVTRETAARLLAGEPLADVLPEITHPELVRGVLGIIEYAADLATQFERFKNA